MGTILSWMPIKGPFRFALSSGIPPQVVMKWTGHSDYQAMKLFEAEMEKEE